ncbi:MAG: hypothetical protein ABSB68_05175 [Acidimicrobiales bacterium]
MPVPLPTAETVNLVPPDAAETQMIADGVASAASGRDGLLPVQRAILVALLPAMTGHPVTLTDRPTVTARQFAEALARRELGFRARMVQSMLLCALVRHPLPDDVADSVAAYASEMGVHDGMVDVARKFAAGSLGLAAFDFARNGYEGAWNEQEASAAVHSTRVLQEAWEVSAADPGLAARWSSLEHLPPDSLGRKVWELYQARGFTFPGTPGSAPPLLAQHDWVHVLADYGTTVEAEVEVFGLIARANDDMRAFSLLAMVISLFETGYLATGAGLFEASPGHLSASPTMAVRLADAMRRGALCHDRETGSDSIDFLRMDWFAVADRTCEDVRARVGLVPKSEEAVAAGSVGPWGPGGISPFQMNAGRQLADARGLPYDAHGASV